MTDSPTSDARTLTFSIDKSTRLFSSSIKNASSTIKAVRSDKDELQADNNSQLESANRHLRKRLQDALLQLQAARDAANIDKNSREPLDVLLREERSQQEARNTKSLALLRSKDDAIEALEVRCSDAIAESAQLKSQLHSTQRQIESMQTKINELSLSNASYEEKLKSAEQIQRENLAKAHQEAADKDAAAQKTIEQLNIELKAGETLHEQDTKDIERMQNFITRLLGVAVESSSPIIIHGCSGNEDSKEELERANEALERALVHANLRLAGITPSMHSTPDALLTHLESETVYHVGHGKHQHHQHAQNSAQNTDDDDYGVSAVAVGTAFENFDELAKLSAKLSQLYEELDGEKSKINRLESMHAVAERAALDAEAELNAALEREEKLAHAYEETRHVSEERNSAIAEAGARIDRLETEKKDLEVALSDAQQAYHDLADRFSSLQAESSASKEMAGEAVEKYDIISSQCDALKSQMLDCQQENDDLKGELLVAERKIAFYSAKTAAQEAANDLMAVWHKGKSPQPLTLPFLLSGGRSATSGPNAAANNNTYGAMQDLAVHLQEAAATRMQLHDQVQAAAKMRAVDRRAIRRMQKSIDRLKTVLINNDDDDENNSDKNNNEEKDKKIGEEAGCFDLDIEGKETSSLHSQLMHAVAAQEGQAACFAALINQLREEETSLKDEILRKQSIEYDFCQIQALCVASIGTLHGALAHMAHVEGDEDAAQGLLQAEVDPRELGVVAAAVAAKVQQCARLISDLRKQEESDELSPAAALSISQREVIKALSAQLACGSHIDGGGDLDGDDGNDSDAIITNKMNTNNKHLVGLCMLLSHQLDHVSSATNNNNGEEDFATRMQSMQNTLYVLRAELTAAQPKPGSNDDVCMDVHTMEQHIVSMAEKIASLNERIALLTSANHAAQAEANHAKQATQILTEEYENKRSELVKNVKDAQEELKKAVMRLDESENERKILEKRISEHMMNDSLQGENEQQKTPSTSPRHRQKNKDTTASNEALHSDENKEIPPGLLDLLDGLESLLTDAATTETRLRELESIAREHAQYKAENARQGWNRLTAGVLRARGIASTWSDAQQEYRQLEEQYAEQAHRADAAIERSKHLEKECKQLTRQMETLQELHKEQAQQSTDLHAAQLAASQAAAQIQRRDLQHQIEITAQKSMEIGQKNARNELQHSIQSAQQALSECQHTCIRLRAERDALHAEFRKFRELKGAEIRLLENRLGIQYAHDGAHNFEYEIATCEGEIAAACKADAVAAALREAKLERAHRQEIQDALNAAKIAEKKAKAAGKAAEQQVTTLRQRLRESTVIAEDKNRKLAVQLQHAQEEASKHSMNAAVLEKKVSGLTNYITEHQRQSQILIDRDINDAHAVLEAQSRAMHEMKHRVLVAEEDVEQLGHEV